MENLKIYCLDLNNENYNKITNLGYTPVGLGQNRFDSNWVRDNTGINISHKNKYYGEYTFHYWFWKNLLNTIDEHTWIGFCAYRRFWLQDNFEKNIKYKKDFLSFVPDD